MKHIVFDCDCTFGVRNCDVDDGLALLYLLGAPDADLLGVTATYGNNRIEVVMDTLRRMRAELGRRDLPLHQGGACAGAYDSDAARFLAETAACCHGALSILATGSLTNLYGAYLHDSSFFSHVREIVLMGGITAPLLFEKKEMEELNFSCDPLASLNVLCRGKHVSVMTGNNCLSVLFQKKEYMERLFVPGSRIGAYIREQSDDWFRYNEEDYGIGGFYNWDACAAAYLMQPSLFTDHWQSFSLTEEALCRGFLQKAEEAETEMEAEVGMEAGMKTGAETENTPPQNLCAERKDAADRLRPDRHTDRLRANCRLNLPEISAPEAFKNSLYETWLRVPMPGIS